MTMAWTRRHIGAMMWWSSRSCGPIRVPRSKRSRRNILLGPHSVPIKHSLVQAVQVVQAFSGPACARARMSVCTADVERRRLGRFWSDHLDRLDQCPFQRLFLTSAIEKKLGPLGPGQGSSLFLSDRRRADCRTAWTHKGLRVLPEGVPSSGTAQASVFTSLTEKRKPQHPQQSGAQQ